MHQQSDNMRLNAELIGYHLGLLDEESRAKVEAAFPDKASLDAACERVAKCLRQLDADQTPQPPVNLVAGIMDRVEASKKTIPFPGQTAAEEVSETQRPARSMMRIRELIGMAAAIALFAGVFVPGYRTTRMVNQQRPNVASLQDAARDNGGAGFQLVNGSYATPMTVACPGRGVTVVPQMRGTTTNMLHNAAAPYILTQPLRVGDLAADSDNRGGQDSLHGSGTQRRACDIGSLGRPGLQGTWTVRFYSVPYAAGRSDDIYRLIGAQEYTGLARPAQRSDACLVP